MIVIHPALLSTPESAASRDLPRVCYQTYTSALSDANVVASSAADDGPKDAPLRPEDWEFWKPTALPATWEVDLDGVKQVDYVGIAGQDFASKSVAVKVELGIGSDYTTLGEVAPADDRALLFLGEAQACNKVRITLTGVGEDMPSMAVVYVGQALVMQRTIYGGHTPLTLSRKTDTTTAQSEGGKFLGQTFVGHGLTGSASFRYLTAAWVRQNLDPFIKAARGQPFFFAWRPSTWPLEVAYAWAKGDIVPANMGKRDFMSVSWKMDAAGNA